MDMPLSGGFASLGVPLNLIRPEGHGFALDLYSSGKVLD